MEKTDTVFDTRNEDKKSLQKIDNKSTPNIWEIWMYKTWVNLGNEISKEQPFMRPCIVLNNFIGWDLILTVPLTSKKHNGKFEIDLIEYWSYWLSHMSYALINQIKPISKKRLIYKINARKIWMKRMALVGKAIMETIKLSYATRVLKI